MRLLLQILVPLLLPIGIYAIWTMAMRQWAQARGGPVPSLADGPWMWLIGGGIVLMILALIAFALLQPTFEAGEYVPPRFENGEIIPGQVRPPQ